MTAEPLPGAAQPAAGFRPALGFEPDAPLDARPTDPGAFASALGHALDAASGALQRADSAERAFVRGAGGLQEMVLERARADIALSIASAAASRTAQALTTVLGMQV